MFLRQVLVPTFFLLLAVFVFIYTDRIYDFFLELQYDYDRMLKGDDVKPPRSLLFGRKISVFVGRVVSLFGILFSLFMLWLFFLSGWESR